MSAPLSTRTSQQSAPGSSSTTRTVRPGPHGGGDPAGILIIGAGLAGLFTALRLAPLPVTVVAAAPLGDGASSAWAQGGIAAAVGEGDTPEKHAADTLAAGGDLVDPAIAALVAEEARARIEDLLRYGVPFDRDLEGRLSLSREAAHSARRVVRVKGDGAGRAIMAALVAAVRQTPSIRVIEKVEARELLTDDGRVVGARIWPVGSHGPTAAEDIFAQATVLTTGGVGQLFAVTTNPAQAVGDGIAMAARAGAVIADPEFVQFHPTAIRCALDPAPLATEALRGEGAVLIDGSGHRFMADVHADGELAPRDIVARAVHRENVSGRGALLDCRDAIGDAFAHRFPTVHAKCLDAGIDPATAPIPVAPAAHYHMGGVAVDARGRTTVDGLWACGEVASTGLHGANRLASNSLIEAVVFGARVAEDIVGLGPLSRGHEARLPMPSAVTGSAVAERVTAPLVARIREAMSRHAGVERDLDGLRDIVDLIEQTEEKAGADLTLRNRLLATRFVVAGAIARSRSEGSHFRADTGENDEPQVSTPGQPRRTFLRARDLASILSADRHAVSPDGVVVPFPRSVRIAREENKPRVRASTPKARSGGSSGSAS
ncbi:MAG: L-aspartate oxidase [Pseudomonadota bacterium]